MDYEKIILHLLPSKYDVQFKKNSDQGYLLLKTLILGEEVTLVHYCVSEFEGLPQFCLEEADKYGVLAHVLPDKEKGTGSICLNAPESVSVNFDRPELAFEESLNRHFDLLGKALSNPEWNREELLREFASNWVLDFSSICGVLLCASAPGRLEEVSIVDAARAKKKDLLPYYMAVSEKDNDLIRSHYMQGKSNQRQEKAIGYVIPLASVEPPPQYNDDLGEWYIDALNRIVPERQGEFKRCYTQFRSNQFWIVFNAPTPSGITWFGLRLKCDVKKTLPIKKEKITGWHFQKFIVRIFNKESIMPRSGANPILDRKKVLLIGCGSVGSEIALMLGSAGLGHIDLADPDIFQISNIYRHTLSMYWLNYFKSLALSVDLKARFPWINTGYSSKRLLSYRNTINAKEYDLIIIAIGSPTHERLFHKFLQENKVNIPVINTWLEGYGIGGHATLDIPISKGCLLCAYVENATGIRGLASNLNFFEADQDIAINYAGCGELFLPYGAISSAQTALIASDLAIHYLEGKITESKKVSWKGDSTEALEQGIGLTSRYHSFNESLKHTPLYNPRCDVCRGEPGATYTGEGIVLNVTKDVVAQWESYRQISVDSVECAGLLIAHRENESIYWIDSITTPKEQDINRYAYFKLDHHAHQSEINQAFVESQQGRGYLGTWHTHPEINPNPSLIDRNDWQKHAFDNTDRPLVFVIIGTQSTKMFTLKFGKFIELQMLNKRN